MQQRDTERRRDVQQLSRFLYVDPTPGVHAALTAGGAGVGGVSGWGEASPGEISASLLPLSCLSQGT